MSRVLSQWNCNSSLLVSFPYSFPLYFIPLFYSSLISLFLPFPRFLSFFCFLHLFFHHRSLPPALKLPSPFLPPPLLPSLVSFLPRSSLLAAAGMRQRDPLSACFHHRVKRACECAARGSLVCVRRAGLHAQQGGERSPPPHPPSPLLSIACNLIWGLPSRFLFDWESWLEAYTGTSLQR